MAFDFLERNDELVAHAGLDDETTLSAVDHLTNDRVLEMAVLQSCDHDLLELLERSRTLAVGSNVDG